MATSPSTIAICQEVDFLKEEIDDRAGPKTLALMLCVSDSEVQRNIQEYVGDSGTSKIIVESETARYQTRIDALKTSGARRLIIIFSTNFNDRLSIPAEFTSCEFICCNGAEASFSDSSTYCGIRLGLWNTRRTYKSHSLLAHPYVYFEMVVEPDVPESPRHTRASEAQQVALAIQSMSAEGSHSDQDIDFLACLAGAAGVVTTGAALRVANLSITTKGIHVSCQTAACNVSFTVSASASAAVGAGVAVAAAVYFIPWAKLAVLMNKAWDHFVKLIGILWKFLGNAMDLLKRFIHVIAVVLSDAVNEVTKCIAEFIAFVCKNFPALTTMNEMPLSSSMALGKSGPLSWW